MVKKCYSVEDGPRQVSQAQDRVPLASNGPLRFLGVPVVENQSQVRDVTDQSVLLCEHCTGEDFATY